MDEALQDQAIAIVADNARSNAAALFLPGLENALGETEARREYTAERLMTQHPEKFRAIVHYLAQGYGMLRIAKMVGVHHLSAAAVRDRFPLAVDIERQRLSKLARMGAELCLERIIEEVGSLPKQTLGLTAAQLIDKFQLLSGGATSRPEIGPKPGQLTHDDFAAWIDQLPSAKASPAIGLSGEDSGQIARPADGPATDLVSVVSQKTPAGDTHDVTGPSASTAADLEPTEGVVEGGGGGREIARGPRIHTH